MRKSTLLPLIRPECLGLLGCLLAPPALSQVINDLADNQLQRQQQREDARRRLDEAAPDVRLETPAPSRPNGYPEGESPCFVIRQVMFHGDQRADSEPFRCAL